MRIIEVNSKDGFSMIELLVGISILSIALVPIAGFFINNTRMVNDTEEKSQALDLAERVLEDLKGTAAMDNTSKTFTERLNDTADTWSNKSLDGYEIDVIVQDYKGEEDLQKLTVEVSWNLAESKPPSVKLETLLARR